MEFSKVFKSLVDISKNLILIKFSGFFRLVEFSKFLKHKVNISKNPRLINPSRFPKF